MTRVHYEEQLFLKFNEKRWDEKLLKGRTIAQTNRIYFENH